ncbi:hypothetical protein [Streptomyces sp. NPDC101206]|uniref:hypothetical protein n=1 Tax=Streptomyces sp. NPDC101206 TaxID=3366128 RepID=UPI0038265E03
MITIADMAAAQHGVRFSGGDPADRLPPPLPEPPVQPSWGYRQLRTRSGRGRTPAPIRRGWRA